MESFFSRYRNALVLIVVLVAQLLLLAIQAKRPKAEGHNVSLARYAVVTVITPPERLVHNTGHWIRSVWYGYFDLVHVRRQNAQLREEIERLRLEQASIAQDADQGRRLQRMLDFTEHYANKTVAAQVIGTGGTDQSQVLYIDKGSKDGLQQDDPVITTDGIVGRLKDVFPHTSQVLLATDPTSGIGVVLETTRIRGILKGRPWDQLQIVDVSPDSRIKAGEPVVTSGGDQIFPRGLPVGTVDRVIPDPDRDPLVDVLVHPAAKLSQLEEVLVISDLSDSVPSQESKDIAESEDEAAQKRASDVLSERLPSRIDANAPADTNPEQLVDAAGNAVAKLPPPKPAHPDGFSPNSEPSALQMVPGQRSVPVKEGIEQAPAAKPHSAPSASASSAASTTASGNAETSSAKPQAPPKTASGAATQRPAVAVKAPSQSETAATAKSDSGETKPQKNPTAAPTVTSDAGPPKPKTTPQPAATDTSSQAPATTKPATTKEDQQASPAPPAPQTTPPGGLI